MNDFQCGLRIFTHEQWLMRLGDNPWGLMDLTDAKEETRLASDLLDVFDRLPGGFLMTHPFGGADYDVYPVTVELDELLD